MIEFGRFFDCRILQVCGQYHSRQKGGKTHAPDGHCSQQPWVKRALVSIQNDLYGFVLSKLQS